MGSFLAVDEVRSGAGLQKPTHTRRGFEKKGRFAKSR